MNVRSLRAGGRSRRVASIQTHVAAAFACVIACGCGGGDGAVRVSGTVTVAGVPMEQGIIAFLEPDGASAALGFIRNGSYSMERSPSQPGLWPGNYSVVIRSWKEEPGQLMPSGGFSKGISLIPEKYQDPKKSGLKAEIGKSATTVDFELEAKK